MSSPTCTPPSLLGAPKVVVAGIPLKLPEGVCAAVRMGVLVGLAAADVALVDEPRRDSGRDTPTKAGKESGCEAAMGDRARLVSERERKRRKMR